MKKRILLIVAIALAVLTVGTVIYLNSPKVVARNALAGVADDLLDRAELKPLIKMSQKGSMSLSAEIDTATMYGEGYLGEQIDASFGGTLYFGKKSLFLKNAYLDLSLPERRIDFEGSADLYIGKQYAYLESDLVGGAVGMIKGEMTEALKNSELAPEMPEELYRELLPAMKKYDGISEDPTSENLLLKHLMRLISSFEKNADYKSEMREVLLQGEHAKCRVITITLDREALRAVLNTLLESLADEDVKALLDDNQWLLEPILIRLGLLSEYAKIESLSSYLTDALETEADGLKDESWRLEIVTPRFSSELLSLRLLAEEESIFFLNLGEEGIQNSSCMTLSVGKVTYCYFLSQSDADGYTVSLTRDGEEVLFSLAVDKNAQAFELAWREGKTERSLVGAWIETQKSTTVTAEKFTDENGKWIDEGFSVELTFTIKDSMPGALKKSEIRNVFDLTLDDVWEIITKSRGLFKIFI